MKKEIKYNLILTKRKSIALIIDRNAELIIRAPRHTPKYVIDRVINEKEEWIEQKKNEVALRNQIHPKKRFIYGEIFYFKGQPLELIPSDDPDSRLHSDGQYLLLGENHLHIARRELLRFFFTEWYKIIPRRVEYYAKLTGYFPRNIRISKASTKWGSCNSKAQLSLNWKLIMLPPEIADYIIVHELIHIAEMNHSKKFWEKVAGFCPDYQSYKKWLRANNRLFDF